MNTPTIYVRLSCLLDEGDRADDEEPTWADDEPINPECDDDQQEN